MPCLPYLTLAEIHRDPLRLRFRLVGTEIVQLRGGEFTWRWLEELALRSELYAFVRRLGLELRARREPVGDQVRAAFRGVREWRPTIPIDRYEENLRRIVEIASSRGAEVWLLTAPRNPDPGEDYSVEEVPWVQYFDDDNGLHAAYWHRSFGRPVSHGCVNLAPLDARFMFEWTTPALPAGWFTVRPSASEPATLVRVR